MLEDSLIALMEEIVIAECQWLEDYDTQVELDECE